jgi:cobaltochelatase CobN
MFEVYVQDKYDLDIRARFETAGNLRAYQSMVDRMLVAVDKGYWAAAPETIATLRDASAKAAQQIAAEEKAEIETLPDAAPATLPPLPEGRARPPGAPPLATPPPQSLTPLPQSQPQQVEGKALEDISPKSQPPATAPSATAPSAAAAPAAAFPARLAIALAAALALFALGWFRQGRASRRA